MLNAEVGPASREPLFQGLQFDPPKVDLGALRLDHVGEEAHPPEKPDRPRKAKAVRAVGVW